jgi:hypothetical protein
VECISTRPRRKICVSFSLQTGRQAHQFLPPRKFDLEIEGYVISPSIRAHQKDHKLWEQGRQMAANLCFYYGFGSFPVT